MSKQYILYEHAAGYALFYTEPEESTLTADIVSDVLKFKEMCHFVVFQPFKRGREALENINSLSESILHPHLEELLSIHLPKKKKKFVLGVEDTQLIKPIQEKIDINCNSSDAVKELIRGIRFHFHNLVPGFCDLNAATKAQLGLAHAYSRSKVKFNVGRVDNMIIQTITLLDQMDKDINSLSMRIREWYSHHFPELLKIVPENALYIQCVNAVGDRKNMPVDAQEQLEKILNDPEKVNNVIELARSSMGMDISNSDLENMYFFVKRVIALSQRRKDLTEYLKNKMSCIAPNLAALLGEFISARLIAQAGSLTNLAKAPASTVQILGAEKALFRALKTRGNTPKYGLLFHSKFIGKAKKSYKGAISRYLANKCSVASRIDCFRDIPTDAFGNKMKEQVEERLKFFEASKTGETPRKNNEVMLEALEEAEISQHEFLKNRKKEEKRAKKRKLEELYLSAELDQTMAALTEGTIADEVLDSSAVKKKKKRKLNNVEQELTLSAELEQSKISMNESITDEVDTSLVKKKKKMKLTSAEQEQSMTSFNVSSMADDVDTSLIKKKKKKKSNNIESELTVSTELDQSMASLNGSIVTDDVDTSLIKKKKKKKLNDTEAELCVSTELNQSMASINGSVITDDIDTSLVKKKKKKRELKDTEQDQSMTVLSESLVADEGNTSAMKKKGKLNDSHHELSISAELDQSSEGLPNGNAEVNRSVIKKKSKKNLNDTE